MHGSISVGALSRGWAAVLVVGVASGAAAERVTGVATVVGPDNGLGFTSITVEDGGFETTLAPSDLIGIEVRDFAVATTIPFETALGGTVSTPSDPSALPAVGSRAALLEDDLLNTTINNPSVSTGLVFGFVGGAGVLNRPGIDLLVFEISPPAGVEPPSGGPTVLGGDPFRLSGTGAAAGNSAEFFAADYEQIGPNGTASNISFFGPAAGTDPVASLSDFESVELSALGVFSLNLYGAGVDLSDLGFAEGETVSELVLTSIGETGFGADPSLIVGLEGSVSTAVPTPSAGIAGMLGLFGLALRRTKASAD
ncbi:MAG: hypothetical protein AAGE65_07035 [Planctomycetota bacterium]